MSTIAVFPEEVATGFPEIPNGDAGSDAEEAANETDFVQNFHSCLRGRKPLAPLRARGGMPHPFLKNGVAFPEAIENDRFCCCKPRTDKLVYAPLRY